MARPRIGLYRRVSTRHQLDNDRYLRAIDDMTAVMARHNADIVVYDEGGIARSGGTIRGRKVFLAMLADVASGQLNGIAAPDVRSLSRGEWLIDGKTIADTLIRAGALLFTRYSRLDLRNHADLKAFQDELYYAMKERDEIRQRFYEGQAARALNVVEGKDEPWGRHRTMIGHRLVVLLDASGQPRITNRGLAKRAWAKDPAQAETMATLIRALDAQPNRGALFAALYDAGITGPELSAAGGWTKRSLQTLLRSPFHQGLWKLVRNPKATVWYGLDPRVVEFDASKVVAECPELAYWTPAQAKRWEEKFMADDDRTRRAPADKGHHPHPLLGLLRCPRCHETLLGKGVQGYICPRGARGTRAQGPCLPIFTVRESSAQAALRGLLPLLEPRLGELRDEARAWLKRRNDGVHEVQLRLIDNQERAILAQTEGLVGQGLDVPESFTERLIELGRERKRVLAEQDQMEQVEQSRLEAERALAGIEPAELTEAFGRLDGCVVAEVYRAFFEWVEVRPNGPGRTGGTLVAWMFQDPQNARCSRVVEQLLALLPAA
jgi:hypothetical protein